MLGRGLTWRMMTISNLDGQVAVVTGAGGTLCSAISRHLAQQGARVALVGRSLPKLAVLAQAIKDAGGEALALQADVTSEAEVERVRAAVHASWGPCRFLINGAGGNQPEAVTTLNEFSPEELKDSPDVRGFFNLAPDVFSDVIRVNTMGTVIPCRAFGRDMAARRAGSIINFASMNSYRPLSRVGAYGMSKAGVVNFTQWLAAYLAPANVRVNGIAPGFFVNERSRKILYDAEGGLTSRGRQVIAHTPMRKFGEEGALLGTVSWLLSDELSGFVTGITVPVDGGFLASSGI